ncbi:SRPBCC family protein [uncultured Tateyamaria sp.]|uniref:SRPBCC family protein n=1 Tax=uncultured Tateyamaria sp. TaxID=455651 RepID=UPI00261326AC|nr:SRPBCC family protein [uncultured Tateyamaria sp.]
MDTSKIARAFLGLNSIFSILIGADLLIAPGHAAELLFAQPATWHIISLRILGVGLALFGMCLLLMRRNRFLTKGQVAVISALDFGWVLASAVVLIIYGAFFTVFGKTAIVLVAGIVAIFAIGQLVGARKIVPGLSDASVTTSGGQIRAKVSRAVKAPADVVWKVMNDHPGYADVAENLSKVEVIKGNGMGMQRVCYGPKGENWLETCNLFKEGRVYGFRVHTEAEDYPYPISDLHGAWSVEQNGTGAKFAIDIKATPKGNVLVRTLFKLAARRQFKVILADLAEGWAARMEREARS